MEIVVVDSPGLARVKPFLSDAISRLGMSTDGSSGGGICDWAPFKRAIRRIQDYCCGISASGADVELTIVCAVDNHDFILKYVSVISRSVVVRRPRLVLVSSLLSWSGAKEGGSAVNATSSFLKRSPVRGFSEEFNLENLLWNTCSACKSGLAILSYGLLYGKNGYDVESIFSAIFNGRESVSFNIPGDGSNCIPYIHVDAFVDMLATVLGDANSGGSVEYVPCCEPGTLPIKALVSQMSSKLGGKEISIVGLSNEDYLQYVLNDDSPCVYDKWDWSVNANFTSNQRYPCKSDIFATIDADFNVWLKANNMLPCGMMVTGGPQMGKSTSAKAVAQALSIEFVDVLTCVKYVLLTLPATLDLLSKAQQDILSAFTPAEGFNYNSIITDVATQIETKINSAKKKGAEDVKFASMDKSAIDLSFAAVNEFPVSSVRGFVYVYILFNEACKKKGIVLDIWGYKAFSEIESMKTLRFIANFEVICDVSGPAKSVVDRLIKTLGITGPIEKAPKDAQAKIKEVEAIQSAYSGQLIDDKHPLLTAMEQEGIAPLMQINTEQSLDDMALECIAKLIEVHGKIGWYSQGNAAEETDHPLSSNDIATAAATTATPASTTSAIATSTSTSEATTKKSNFETMNDQLTSALNPEELNQLKGNCDDLVGYLNGTVMSQISRCMVEIIRNRPEDPIQYLANYLKHQADLTQSAAEQEAKEQFYRVYAEANSTI